MKDKKKGSIIDKIALGISIISLFVSGFITYSQLNLEREIREYERKEKSSNHISKVYDKIMDSQKLSKIWEKVTNGEPFEQGMKTRLFVDQIEGLGGKYCQTQVFTKDLKDYTPFFEKICNHGDIIRIYKGKKNGLSKICLDVIGEKGMGKYYEEKNYCKVLK